MEDKKPKELTLYDAVVERGLTILNKTDFTAINGRIEITRDGALKILSSLPISYSIETLEEEIKEDYVRVKVKLRLEFHKTGIWREAVGTGICEKDELIRSKQYSRHNLYAKAETRAIKRAIETALGGIINAIILKLFGSYQVGGGR